MSLTLSVTDFIAFSSINTIGNYLSVISEF